MVLEVGGEMGDALNSRSRQRSGSEKVSIAASSPSP